MSGQDKPVAAIPREARNSNIQGRFENLRCTVGKLEALVDELAGKENGDEAKSSPMEAFQPFWENLSEMIDAVAERIEKSTEDIRQMIL